MLIYSIFLFHFTIAMNNPTEKTDWWDSLGRKILGGFGNAAIFSLLMMLGYWTGAHKLGEESVAQSNVDQSEQPTSTKDKIAAGIINPETMSTAQQDSLHAVLQEEKIQEKALDGLYR